MENDSRIYQIAFTLIKGIGSIVGRNILSNYETPEAFFKEKPTILEKIPGITQRILSELKNPDYLIQAEKELIFAEKNNIRILFCIDNDYPIRLNECMDAPLLLYYKGNADLNKAHVLSIVGTRNATFYGQEMCKELLLGIGKLLPDTLICSGLAYGVDIHAHQEALLNHLPTVGVLGHGLDRIYPSTHRNTAIEMLQQGGLLTEFMSKTNPDRPNFVMRNRIIAGMADATIVIESAVKGGSLITANIAHSYNREVLAVPGKKTDAYSQGCNKLIKENKAALVESAEDVLNALGWNYNSSSPIIQKELFIELTEEEKHIIHLLSNKENEHINQLVIHSNIPIGKLSCLLLDMEMKGLIQALPGCLYKRC